MKIPQCSVTRSCQTTDCARYGCTVEFCRSLGGRNMPPVEIDESRLAPFSQEDYARIESAVQLGFERAAQSTNRNQATVDEWARTLSRVRDAQRSARGLRDDTKEPSRE